jgi:hypothetical protein
MSRSLRGLSAGLQTGLQLGGALRGVRQQRALADESARFNVTEGAYGSELDQNVEQVQGLMRQAQQQAAAQGGTVEDMARIEREYMPAIEELQRRSQMTAPDFTVASRAMRPEDTFATREEAARAARPMRAEGLAGVYRDFGDVEKADEMMERADTARMRGLQVEQAERTAAAQKRVDNFSAWRAENPDATVQQLKDAARTQFKLTDDELLGVTANIAGLQENELKIWKNEVTDAIKGKNLDEIVELYNTDERFDPTTDIKVSRRGGRVSVAVVDKAGNTISTESFESDAAAQAYLRRQALEPDTLADWLLQRKKIESGIGLQGAQAQALRDRPAGRQPTEAEVTARANLYLNNDSTGELTAAQAVALARRDLGRGGDAEPVSDIARLADLINQRLEEERKARENPQAGLR